jgi:hypothetical protein
MKEEVKTFLKLLILLAVFFTFLGMVLSLAGRAWI